jgi:hypothetical protein
MSHTAARESQSIEFTVLWQASFKKLLSCTFAARSSAGLPGSSFEPVYQEFGVIRGIMLSQNPLIRASRFCNSHAHAG